MSIRLETELYAPIKLFLQHQGYEVRAEVKHCDLLAVRGDEPLVIIELKKTLNLPLLVQGIQRKQYTDLVYIAIELPPKGKAPHGLTWSEIRQLCGMLSLGLITVHFDQTNKPTVDVICEPIPYPLRTNIRGKRKLLHEFYQRSGDYNIGGSSQQKVMTAYRERALHCAYVIHTRGALSPREIRVLTGNKSISNLLQKNYYQWFVRTHRGIYDLTSEGVAALTIHSEIIAHSTYVQHSTLAST